MKSNNGAIILATEKKKKIDVQTKGDLEEHSGYTIVAQTPKHFK